MRIVESCKNNLAYLILAIALAVSVLAIDPTAAARGAGPARQSDQDSSSPATASSQDQPSTDTKTDSKTDSKTDAASKAASVDSKVAQASQQGKSDANKQEDAAKNDEKEHKASKSTSGSSGDSNKTEPEMVTIPANTVISVRMTEAIDVRESKPGQEYTASINEPVLANNQVVIPRGAAARVRLLHSKKAGHVRGRADVVVELVGVILHNKNYPIRSSIVEKKGAGIGSKMKNGAQNSAQAAASVAVDAVTAPAVAPIEAVPAAVSPAAILLSAQQLKLDGTRIDFVLRTPIDLPLPES